MISASKGKSIKKWTKVILVDFLLLVFIFIIFILISRHYYHPNLQINGILIKNPKEIADIKLIDHYGREFTKAQLKNHWAFIFFGFTHCPIICPSTLDKLNKTYTILEKKLPSNLLPQVVFISIDPERDSISRLRQFINSYNTHFIGTKTAATETKSLEKKFSLTVSNIEGNIIHNTDILLLNPKAQIQAYFLYPHHPQNMANDYLKIIKKNAW